MRRSSRAFTLTEILLAIAVLAVLVLLIARLINGAVIFTTLSNKRLDADSNARPLLDRMAVDFAQMVKRNDVSYYLKTRSNTQEGNDQIAFFSAVTGYYPSPSKQSPFSLVAYRVNSDPGSRSYNKVERMGKGLLWNGASPTYLPILFLAPSSTFPTTTIANTWPAAASDSLTDPDYEPVGPQVFRFEYYYMLTNGEFSTGPWSSLNTVAIRDVAAIVVAIAVIDAKSKMLLTNSQIAAITEHLPNYVASMGAGALNAEWQNRLDTDPLIAAMPRSAISGIRVCERYFYLSPPSP
jgi:prepilin-type N-terminal cleavage/methylation domain-containing protein